MRWWWLLGVIGCGRLDFDPATASDFELVVGPISWTDAEAACKVRTMHLATIANAAENGAAAMYAATIPFDPSIINTNQRQRMWLGANDLQSTWQWVTAEPFAFTNWRMNEPSTNNEHCLILLGSQDGLWDNRACDFIADAYLCER